MPSQKMFHVEHPESLPLTNALITGVTTGLMLMRSPALLSGVVIAAVMFYAAGIMFILTQCMLRVLGH